MRMLGDHDDDGEEVLINCWEFYLKKITQSKSEVKRISDAFNSASGRVQFRLTELKCCCLQ